MRNERGPTLGLAPILPGLVLVVIIGWALAAVLMLTGTLINAREIDDTIPLIQNQVGPIDKDLDNVKLAAETARISGKIRERAAPLTDQADQIIEVARNIDAQVAGILRTATSINETAVAINGTVGSINDKVSSINRNVRSINDNVGAIQSNVLTIGGNVDTIGSRVTSIGARVRAIFAGVGPQGATDPNSIKASVTRITRTFRVLQPETVSIDSGVSAINRRAAKGISGVKGLKGDLAPVFVTVGLGSLAGHNTSGPGTIHGHANSIDCAALINSLGPTQYCNR